MKSVLKCTPDEIVVKNTERRRKGKILIPAEWSREPVEGNVIRGSQDHLAQQHKGAETTSWSVGQSIRAGSTFFFAIPTFSKVDCSTFHTEAPILTRPQRNWINLFPRGIVKYARSCERSLPSLFETPNRSPCSRAVHQSLAKWSIPFTNSIFPSIFLPPSIHSHPLPRDLLNG